MPIDKEDLDETEERLKEDTGRRLNTLSADLNRYVTTRVGWATGLLASWIALLNYLMG